MAKWTQQVVDAIREIDEIAIGITYQSKGVSATIEEQLVSMEEIAQKWVKSIFVSNCDDEELYKRDGFFTRFIVTLTYIKIHILFLFKC